MANALSGVFRTIYFVGAHGPPISLWGRLRTGGLIIPGYDKVFLAPFGAMVVFVVLETVFLVLKTPLPVAQPLVAAACLAVWLNVGPTMRDWELTGEHRIRPSSARLPTNQFTRI